MGTRTRLLVLLALGGLALGAATTASAKGALGGQFWLAGGYHRSITVADNGLEGRLGGDLKIGPLGLGISGRFNSDKLDGAGFMRGAWYFDVTLMVPLPVIVPYLRVGVGMALFIDEVSGEQPPYLALHQGLGFDVLIPKHLAIGLLFDVDENIHRETLKGDVGLTSLLVFKIRG